MTRRWRVSGEVNFRRVVNRPTVELIMAIGGGRDLAQQQAVAEHEGDRRQPVESSSSGCRTAFPPSARSWAASVRGRPGAGRLSALGHEGRKGPSTSRPEETVMTTGFGEQPRRRPPGARPRHAWIEGGNHDVVRPLRWEGRRRVISAR